MLRQVKPRTLRLTRPYGSRDWSDDCVEHLLEIDVVLFFRDDVDGLRVAWSTDMGFAEVDPRVRDAFEAAIPAFEELRCEVRNACPDLSETRDLFKWVMFSEAVGSCREGVPRPPSAFLASRYFFFFLFFCGCCLKPVASRLASSIFFIRSSCSACLGSSARLVISPGSFLRS